MSEFWLAAWSGLGSVVALAIVGWVASVRYCDASLADRLWPLFFLLAAMVYVSLSTQDSARVWVMLLLVSLWSVRLAVYITWRNWGHGEDRRYTQMRQRHGGAFVWRSLFIVFGLQGVLAWLISAPLLTASFNAAPFTWLDGVACLLVLFGIVFETIADLQLAAFKRAPSNQAGVMDRGLWRYSRHPNYFGEACVWWGLGLLGCTGSGWWPLLSPLLMTFLLLRVSGVTLLEKDIGDRRPAYRDYIQRTNAFIPGPPKDSA